VDEGKSLRQKLAFKAEFAENTKAANISAPPMAIFFVSLCFLCIFVAKKWRIQLPSATESNPVLLSC